MCMYGQGVHFHLAEAQDRGSWHVATKWHRWKREFLSIHNITQRKLVLYTYTVYTRYNVFSKEIIHGCQGLANKIAKTWTEAHTQMLIVCVKKLIKTEEVRQVAVHNSQPLVRWAVGLTPWTLRRWNTVHQNQMQSHRLDADSCNQEYLYK